MGESSPSLKQGKSLSQLSVHTQGSSASQEGGREWEESNLTLSVHTHTHTEGGGRQGRCGGEAQIR
jgi:hypothetical protein